MENIFDSYTVKNMLKGTLFMDKTGIQFTIAPWRTVYDIYLELGVSLPHIEFKGVIGNRIDRGESSELKIKSFILDSIVAPWSFGNLLRLGSDSIKLFFSESKVPSDRSLGSPFFSFFSEIAFKKYLEWTSQDKYLEREKALTHAVSLLVNALKSQIYREYLAPNSYNM